MAKYLIEDKANYIVVTDAQTGKKVFDELKKNVEFETDDDPVGVRILVKDKYRIPDTIGINVAQASDFEQDLGSGVATHTIATLEEYMRVNTGGFNSASGSSEAINISTTDGTDASNTLIQKDGSNWSVSSDTTPSSSQIILNSDLISYTTEGNKRYYTMSFYFDNDSPFSFQVNGAKDVVSVIGVGFPLGSGDFANRATIVRKTGTNEITIDRDNDNNVDMRVDLVFTAIM